MSSADLESWSAPPQPSPDVDSEGFWQATAEGKLRLCRCTACGLWLQPPLERCSACDSPTTWQEVSGRGEVYSFIVVRQASVPGYLEDLPYVVALVELDEQVGLRLPSRLDDIEPDAVEVGMRVQARLEPHPGGDYTVAVFHPE